MKHPAWFAGAVLVDASIPNFFTDAETDHLFKGMQSLPLDTKEHRTTDAMIAAWPRFNRKFHKAIWPPQIPCIVIVSEQSPRPGTPDATLWRQAHLVFAHDAKNRQFIVATKSSHDVVRDRSDLVIQSIVKMVTEVKSAKH